jgi:hypothetical protein
MAVAVRSRPALDSITYCTRQMPISADRVIEFEIRANRTRLEILMGKVQRANRQREQPLPLGTFKDAAPHHEPIDAKNASLALGPRGRVALAVCSCRQLLSRVPQDGIAKQMNVLPHAHGILIGFLMLRRASSSLAQRSSYTLSAASSASSSSRRLQTASRTPRT